MSNPRIGTAVPIRAPSAPGASAREGAPPTGGSRFGELVTAARNGSPAAPTLPPPAGGAATAHPVDGASAAPAPAPAHPPAAPGLTELGRSLLARVARGERYVESVVRQGLHGRAFTNDELLVMQAQVYRYTQELELVSKFVERATSTVKTVLQQNG